ncbi:hypothetical protein [Microcoleus vaginatus]|uniref:hypothetical protein n=1 Tax=Microcoleus vaginatus TaxID=119532 RepID=UPI0032A79E4F
MNLIESEKQVTIALIGFPLITYLLTTYCPIAHFSQIRSPDQQKTRSAGPQKPGFYQNTSLQPTDSAKNPVFFVGGEGPETGFFTKILDCSPEIR